MIETQRFIVESTDRENWLEARKTRVTATEVAKAATDSGFKAAVLERQFPTQIDDNPFMEFGRDNENWIAMFLKEEHDTLPNRWLIQSRNNPHHAATPDGLSLDHIAIAEIKTGGKEEYVKPPIQYRRQMQWQMYCTDAAYCVYAFMLRTPEFQPAWMEPSVTEIARDESMIADLVKVANRLLEATEEVFA